MTPRFVISIALLLVLTLLSSEVHAQVVGRFVGSSPCGDAIRRVLGIPADADSEIIRWNVTLNEDHTYKLRCDHGPAEANTPGLGKVSRGIEKLGRWTSTRGTKSNQNAVVYELSGAVSVVIISADLLHILNPDRSLMVGTAGWSYTLNRLEAAEKPGDLQAALAASSTSRTLTPLSTGPTVHGVFEGRTPCHGIARALKLAQADEPGCIKTKWRITLYQDPQTGAPTTYKVESTVHRQGPREGKWTVARGTKGNPQAVIFHLEASQGENPLLLLKGDDNVLFFLDWNEKPLVGHVDFSYTLNRRSGE